MVVVVVGCGIVVKLWNALSFGEKLVLVLAPFQMLAPDKPLFQNSSKKRFGYKIRWSIFSGKRIRFHNLLARNL